MSAMRSFWRQNRTVRNGPFVTGEPPDLKLGTLLSYFEIVSEKEVKRGLVLSQHAGLPLGKSLVMLDLATPEVVRATVEAQSMLKDGLLKYDHAREAMGVVHRKRWSLTDALVLLGIDAHATRGTRLGELLLSSGYINENNLEMALKTCDASGLPLGRVLVLLSKLSEPSLDLALKLQRAVRSRDVTRQAAIEQLESERVEAERIASSSGEERVRIGELLVDAGLLKDSEVESAVEMARANDKMIGEVLTEMGWLNDDVLTAALRLQEMIWNGAVTRYRASEVLRDISALGMTVDEGLREAGLAPTDFQTQVNFCDFLRMTGYLDRELMKTAVQAVMSDSDLSKQVLAKAGVDGNEKDGLKRAVKLSFRDNELLGVILSSVRPGDKALIGSALVMHELLKTGKLNLDQAVINFTIRRNGLRFD